MKHYFRVNNNKSLLSDKTRQKHWRMYHIYQNCAHHPLATSFPLCPRYHALPAVILPSFHRIYWSVMLNVMQRMRRAIVFIHMRDIQILQTWDLTHNGLPRVVLMRWLHVEDQRRKLIFVTFFFSLRNQPSSTLFLLSFSPCAIVTHTCHLFFSLLSFSLQMWMRGQLQHR